MLFNSPSFLFFFLPAALCLYFGLCKAGVRQGAILALGLLSLAFYGLDDPQRLLPVILVSIIFNFVVGRRLTKTRGRGLLTFAVAANLLYLGYYKYAGFFAATFFGVSYPVALPIGISFFTLTQIAYLVDAARGEAPRYKLHHYVLFVTFFPHLIAGPILSHRSVIPQFSKPDMFRFDAGRFLLGWQWFAAGLFKKVVIADTLAGYATPVFNSAAKQAPSMAEAWGAALSYCLQLYFDFSGYSDMAIGLGLLFGIWLPFNFNSPYKARSLVAFWRQWHMTLSQFLRDYLYIPLGGSRCSGVRRTCNLFITMLIGGAWHGASWNFVAWGGLHGLGLAINHVWQGSRLRQRVALPVALCWVLTFVPVLFFFVVFRADNLQVAGVMWAAMLGLGSGGSFAVPAGAAWIGAAMAWALLLPNTQQLLLDAAPAWATARRKTILFGCALGIALAAMAAGNVSEFLYFRF